MDGRMPGLVPIRRNHVVPNGPTSTAGHGNPFPDIQPGITEVLALKE